jgi:F420-dependent oxidoreductase-like protein
VSRLSFKVRPQGVGWEAIRDLFLAADELEAFDAGWVFDHFYPILGLEETAAPCLEGWTLLTGLAAVTERLRLGIMVSGNTYRHPAVVANMIATADAIAGGRLEVGLGAGWNEAEHAAYGIELPPLRERFDRLDEALEVLDLLLTREVSSFSGVHYTLRDARCNPKPLQRPRPPFVIGGRGERRTLRIAARWADQWNLPWGSLDELRGRIALLRGYCDELGRDPGEVEVSVQVDVDGPVEQLREAASAYLAAGADHIVLVLPGRDDDRATLGSLAAGLGDLFQGSKR